MSLGGPQPSLPFFPTEEAHKTFYLQKHPFKNELRDIQKTPVSGTPVTTDERKNERRKGHTTFYYLTLKQSHPHLVAMKP